MCIVGNILSVFSRNILNDIRKNFYDNAQCFTDIIMSSGLHISWCPIIISFESFKSEMKKKKKNAMELEGCFSDDLGLCERIFSCSMNIDANNLLWVILWILKWILFLILLSMFLLNYLLSIVFLMMLWFNANEHCYEYVNFAFTFVVNVIWDHLEYISLVLFHWSCLRY